MASGTADRGSLFTAGGMMVSCEDTTREKGTFVVGHQFSGEVYSPTAVVYVPRQRHPKNTMVKTTHIDVPQVQETAEVMLNKQNHLWGAEFGANEYGVVIGGAPLYTKLTSKTPGLLFQDIVRLSIERARTAAQAAKIITELVSDFGVGGNAGLRDTVYSCGSFMCVDTKEVWVVETAGKFWATARQSTGARAISQVITITKDTKEDWSPDLVSFAVKKGWCTSEEDFDFRAAYEDWELSHMLEGEYRHHRTERMMTMLGQKFVAKTGMVSEVMRDHGMEHPGQYSTATPETLGAMRRATLICSHSTGEECPIGSISSIVVRLHVSAQPDEVGKPVLDLWCSGTAAQCVSLYFPFWLDAARAYVEENNMPMNAEYVLGSPIQEHMMMPYDPESFATDPENRFWYWERVHHMVILDFQRISRVFAYMRRKVELVWMVQVETMEEGIRYDRYKMYTEDEGHIARARLGRLTFGQASENLIKWADMVDKAESMSPSLGYMLPTWYANWWRAVDETTPLAGRIPYKKHMYVHSWRFYFAVFRWIIMIALAVMYREEMIEVLPEPVRKFLPDLP